MKKFTTVLAALLTAGTLTAGSIDYLSNQSADYLRTFSRNASLDADAAVYNPAGTVFMTQGWTFGLSNQFIFKLYEDDLYNSSFPSSYNQNFKSTEPTLFLPNAQVVWNTGTWAAFLTTGVVAGGGTAVYNDGVPTFPLMSQKVLDGAKKQIPSLIKAVWTSGNLTATSYYPQLTLGGAYAVNEAVSVSLGLRGIYAYQTIVGKSNYDLYTSSGKYGPTTVEADVLKTALGVGGIAGADWKALPGLLVTTRIETPTSLPFKTTVNNNKSFNGQFTDGDVTNRDLPGIVALGIRYDWDAFSVTASGTGYLLGLSTGQGYRSGYDNFGFETGLSCEYAVLPETLKVSVGGQYTKVGGNAATYNDFDFSLDSQSVGGGVVWTAMKDFDVTLAVSNTFYNSASGNQTDSQYTTYKKNAFTVDVGAQYKLY